MLYKYKSYHHSTSLRDVQMLMSRVGLCQSDEGGLDDDENHKC